MHSVCCCSLPVWRSIFWRRGPRDLFWLRPGSAPGRIWPKNNNTCKGHWVYFMHTEFHQKPSSGYGEVKNVNCLTHNGRMTDDGRRLLCPKNRQDHSKNDFTPLSIWLQIKIAYPIFDTKGNTRGSRGHYCSPEYNKYFRLKCLS